MMKSRNNKNSAVLARRDQLVEELKGYQDNLEDIFENGPQCPEDVRLVKKCVAFTVGEIHRHNTEFKDFQEEREHENE